MNTTECIRITLYREPNFHDRVLSIIEKGAEPLLIIEFEYEYMKRYNLDFSPLIHCSSTQKAIVLSTVLTVKVRSVINDNMLLGRHLSLMVSRT